MAVFNVLPHSVPQVVFITTSFAEPGSGFFSGELKDHLGPYLVGFIFLVHHLNIIVKVNEKLWFLVFVH